MRGDAGRFLTGGGAGAGVIQTPKVAEAMLSVDRGDFCPGRQMAYLDTPQGIGHNATISAPHMHAYALEYSLRADPVASPRILDVGSGSGYLTVAFARLWGERAQVVGVEHVSELVKDAVRDTSKHHRDLLDSGQVRFVVGDGREGYRDLAPYNVIHVGAAATETPKPVRRRRCVAWAGLG